MAFRAPQKISSVCQMSSKLFSHSSAAAENAIVPRQKSQEATGYEVYKPRTAPTAPLGAKVNMEVVTGKPSQHNLQPSRMPAFFQLGTDFSSIQRPINNK